MNYVRRLLGIPVMALMFACSSDKTPDATVVTIKTDTVSVYGQALSVTFPGKVKASADLNLAFRVSGTLLRVPVDVGTYVRKGQLLAEIDPRDFEIQLAATEAEYKQVKGEAERIIALYEDNSVSPNDYEKATYGLQQISAKYHAHQNALKDTRLEAPFDGYVQKRLFDAGETVGAGTPVIALINKNFPEIEINIPAGDYLRRDEFDAYSCSSEMFPGVDFPLELVGISQKANLNQLYTMRLRIKPIPATTRATGTAGDTGTTATTTVYPTPGMSVTVALKYKEKESMLTAIPITALFGEINGKVQTAGTFVWIYNKETNTVSARKVRPTKILTNGTVVISEGLKPGETIVTAGVNTLKEGQTVSPLSPVSQTNVGGLL